MEVYPFQPHPWDVLLHPSMFMHYFQVPENYVHWRELPESHVFSADLPGVRKEEIKVEVEDSRYLIIRTEALDQSPAPPKRFMRKFRLPVRVDIDSISACHEDGVLTITVPRSGFRINADDLVARLEILARAA